MAKAKKDVMKVPNLMELSNEYNQKCLQIEMNGGEITPELEKEYELTTANLKTKARGYFFMLKYFEQQQERWAAFKKEAERCRKASEKMHEFLYNRMHFASEYGKGC